MEYAPVGVVIPAYNSSRVVTEALDSVLSQSLPPAQVVVVDDGSRDDTAERVRAYGLRVEYHRQVNAGPSAARNRGIDLVAQPFVAFLDADDVWHPAKLELQMRVMHDRPEIGMLATDYIDWPVHSFRPVEPGAIAHIRRVTWEELVVRTSILTSSVLVRREVLRTVGDFDRTLRGPEDRDLFLRIAKVSAIASLGVPLIGYRDSVGSLTKYASACEQGMRLILRRLDEQGAWKGNHLLRLKAHSYMHHRCAAAQARAGNHLGAALRSAKSILAYPLPYGRDEVRVPLERVRRLGVNLLRTARLKRPDPFTAIGGRPAVVPAGGRP